MKTVSKIIGLAAVALFALSLIANSAGLAVIDPAVQHALISLALICLGIYLIVTIKRIVFGIICFAAALALIGWYAVSHGLLPL